jgi:hypothetical protein
MFLYERLGHYFKKSKRRRRKKIIKRLKKEERGREYSCSNYSFAYLSFATTCLTFCPTDATVPNPINPNNNYK